MLDAIYALPFDLSLLIFLLGCVLLDLVFGDPQDWPHPVRAQGWALNRLESWARGLAFGPGLGGLAAVGGLVAASAGLAWLATSLPLLGEIAALYLGYAGLALGCLLREVERVLVLLDSGRLTAARVHLAGLVSRDTEAMDENEVCRALGETLAENFNDGFVAPFFWLSLFGPVALWGYKAVSTMDSMWGYRTEAYERLGKAAARADDGLAWIPARLSAIFLWCAGLLALRPVSWSRIMVEARTMDSPNAGWPMSAAAHAAQVSMGGPTSYHGQFKDKPLLGPPGLAWTTDAVRRLRRVVILAAALATLTLAGLGSLLAWWGLG